MDLEQIASTLLLLAMLAIMAAKAAPLISANIAGDLLLEIPLQPVFRVLAQRGNITAILLVLALGSGVFGERWISHGQFVFTLVVATAIILLVPIRYRFTTRGISPNRGTFRPWSDFESWESSGNVIWLRGTGRFGSMKLYVSNKDRNSVAKVLSRYLKTRR